MTEDDCERSYALGPDDEFWLACGACLDAGSVYGPPIGGGFDRGGVDGGGARGG